ncbi:MAG TPA: hypothetical protein VG963_23840 [Polyangiaceae bacterium]|nr:hypothetical protein [Polyangiaceae bacterium]
MSKKSKKLIAHGLVKQLSENAATAHGWNPQTIIAAEPGWRVVIQGGGDEDCPNGDLSIRSICVWMVDSIGCIEPAFLDTFRPVLARAAGRIVAILPPGQHEPLKSGAEESINLTAEHVAEWQ